MLISGHPKLMKIIKRAPSIGLPLFIAFGLAWVGTRIISNERRIKTREIELQIQLEEN